MNFLYRTTTNALTSNQIQKHPVVHHVQEWGMETWTKQMELDFHEWVLQLPTLSSSKGLYAK